MSSVHLTFKEIAKLFFKVVVPLCITNNTWKLKLLYLLTITSHSLLNFSLFHVFSSYYKWYWSLNFSFWLLLEYSNTIDFWILALYSGTLLNSFINHSSFFLYILLRISYIKDHIHYEERHCFLPFLAIYLFACLSTYLLTALMH